MRIEIFLFWNTKWNSLANFLSSFHCYWTPCFSQKGPINSCLSVRTCVRLKPVLFGIHSPFFFKIWCSDLARIKKRRNRILRKFLLCSKIGNFWKVLSKWKMKNNFGIYMSLQTPCLEKLWFSGCDQNTLDQSDCRIR